MSTFATFSFTTYHSLSSTWRRFHRLSSRRELDVVHESLLCLVAADMHHLNDGEFVGEIHIGNATAPGGVGGDAIVAGHHHFPFVVALYGQFFGFLLFFLLHRKFCRHLDRKCRHLLGEVFLYLLYVTVQNLVNYRGEIILVFLTDSFKVGIHYRNLHLVAGFLLNKTDDRCALCGRREVLRLGNYLACPLNSYTIKMW
jgi:hypothetical protein